MTLYLFLCLDIFKSTFHFIFCQTSYGCLNFIFGGLCDKALLSKCLSFNVVVQVWQMEWDVSGMTLATTGHDGMVRLWQSNLNGVWHQQAAFEPTN